jgi:hypothetical protein
MDEQDFLGFVSALGEEFCEALFPVVGRNDVVPQDGYEVFCRTFKQEPSPQMLTSLTESDLEQLRATCEEYLECQRITVGHMRSFVSRTLARWPVDAA